MKAESNQYITWDWGEGHGVSKRYSDTVLSQLTTKGSTDFGHFPHVVGSSSLQIGDETNMLGGHSYKILYISFVFLHSLVELFKYEFWKTPTGNVNQ